MNRKPVLRHFHSQFRCVRRTQKKLSHIVRRGGGAGKQYRYAVCTHTYTHKHSRARAHYNATGISRCRGGTQSRKYCVITVAVAPASASAGSLVTLARARARVCVFVRAFNTPAFLCAETTRCTYPYTSVPMNIHVLLCTNYYDIPALIQYHIIV